MSCLPAIPSASQTQQALRPWARSNHECRWQSSRKPCRQHAKRLARGSNVSIRSSIPFEQSQQTSSPKVTCTLGGSNGLSSQHHDSVAWEHVQPLTLLHAAPTQLAADLQKQRHAADARLEERLQGISIALVGDHTDLNCAVADQLAKNLGYVPVATSRIIQQLTQQRQESLYHNCICTLSVSNWLTLEYAELKLQPISHCDQVAA